MACPRVPLAVGALLLLLAVALGAVPSESAALRRLRGSVACLDCAPGHDLSGVVVAVKCAGDDDGAGLHAAQTNVHGNFDVAVTRVSASASASPCAARVLGATEQLCAPQRLTVARVVLAQAPGSTPSNSSYVLGSRLAFFTRCAAAASGSSAAVATAMADRGHQGNAPPEPELRPTTPPAVRPPPPLAGRISPPVAFGGLPLIFFFPFIPIIGIP